MDGSHYPSNGIIGSSSGQQQYPSPTTLSPHQLQSGSPLPQTLPPLQPSVSAMQQPIYGSHPHTPRTPGTPNTPNSNPNPNGNGPSNGSNPAPQSYQPQNAQPQGRGGHYAMAQNPYAPHQGYATSGPMMPQTTTAPSHPQPIAPAPAGGRGPPVLRPMPPTGMPGGMAPMQHGSGHMLPTAEWKNPGWMGQPEPQGEQPTHVVGSQGRRGILPSAPGRPAAPAAGTGTGKSTVVPVKDADGKFPCPHCTKTYLHAKHLKRHLLRHTGDRPYMCVLCRDTFSRSDILKRHFQKCSIRRGNPTGASHLSHPLAHVRRNQNNQPPPAQKPAGEQGDMSHINGMNNMPPSDGMGGHPFGMVPVSDGMNNMQNDQNQLSRSSSMGNGNTPDRRSMPGPAMGNSQPYPSDVSNSMTNQQMPYSMPPGQNGMPMYGGSNTNQQSSLDWSQMFQAGAHQTFNNNSFPPNLGQTQIATKTELKAEPDRTTDERTGEPLVYHEWGMPTNLPNPYDILSNQILDFFYPPSLAVDPHLTGMNLYFSPDNIKDFIDQYTHFHVHTPLLHVSTFRIMEVYTGLLAVMCCIGACYSDRIGSSEVRDMMDATWLALQRDSKFMSNESLLGPQVDATNADIEELQTIILMIIIHFWNGTPRQRDKARQSFPLLVSQTRKLGLLHLMRDGHRQSRLHRPDFDSSHLDPTDFHWTLWVQQESRVRLMLAVFLCDSAMGLYFNATAQLDPFEIHLPLPCDDAAWDADTSGLCASTLGLYGSPTAQDSNPCGTQRAKQPELDWVLRTLLHGSFEIQPGSTTLYGKFTIIHALIALIRRAQLEGHLPSQGTPPLCDWMKESQADHGRFTPVRGMGQNINHHDLNALSIALDKFKVNWDVDMKTQFPPGTSGHSNPRRHGFSRDGVHFYWLAKYLLKFTTREELDLGPDARFTQVIQYLKGVRAWVMNDGLARGEELGSIGEIDEGFGTTDLTLDMSQLFKPLPRAVEESGITSVKTENGSV